MLLGLYSCRSAPIQDVNSHPIPVTGLSQFQVKRAIMLGCQRAGWKLLSVKPGKIIAEHSSKKGRHSATSKITYNNNTYSINYLSSKNLNYTTVKNDSSDPSQVISDINPFDPAADTSAQDPNKPRQVIHKVYNQWVQTLQSEIDLAFQLPGKAKSSLPATSTQTSTASSTRDCNHVPNNKQVGHIRVNGSRVNIRTGIGKRCSILQTATYGDIFPVLGTKGKWTQIELDGGQTAWIYSSLTKRLNPSESLAASKQTKQSASKPAPPPPPPGKKISIAVIHFKTLNKKAQEIELGNLVSEMFTTKLVNSRSFKIIEREQLAKVVKEMEMNQTGFIDASDAVEVGKMLHADAIITGSVALLGNQIQINARIIEIESAFVLDADTQSNNYTLRNMSRIVENMVRKFSLSLR
ncbi:MAG: SH3 domain-containing protein [Gammaproteobacteria bacterium]|nr:SH3 domain-containing protein [Gammaproteobacteria bacterium]